MSCHTTRKVAWCGCGVVVGSVWCAFSLDEGRHLWATIVVGLSASSTRRARPDFVGDPDLRHGSRRTLSGRVRSVSVWWHLVLTVVRSQDWFGERLMYCPVCVLYRYFYFPQITFATRIAATQINPSYSPGGDDVHSRIIMVPWATRVCYQTAYRSVQLFLQGSRS